MSQRSSSDRRAVHRREFVMPVPKDDREITSRRTGADRRRTSDRRLGVSRRFDERRHREGTVRILVVEGGEQLRNGIRRVLTGAGLEVVGAQEGHAGLTFFRETPPDAVVVNLALPDMDGVEFVRQLKDSAPGACVIAIAPRRTHGTADPLALATGLGAIHELRWPFEPSDLLKLVRQVVPGVAAL